MSEAEEQSVRWIDLTAEEIADLAHRQIEGNFGPVSDAVTALHLIEALATRLRDPATASADLGAEGERLATVHLVLRPDGGLRVWSDDEPGLILSGRDPVAVGANIVPAILALRAHRAERVKP